MQNTNIFNTMQLTDEQKKGSTKGTKDGAETMNAICGIRDVHRRRNDQQLAFKFFDPKDKDLLRIIPQTEIGANRTC